MVCDIVIAGSMLYYLRWSRKVLRGKATIVLVTRILKLTVESGLLCAAVLTVSLTLFVVLPHTEWYILPAMIVSKLYSNSLLAVRSGMVRP